VGRGRAWMAPVVTLALVATSCTGGTEPPPTPSLAAAPKGGTLRLMSPDFVDSGLQKPAGPDPQKDYITDSWELFRCCLLRTLLSNRGAPTSEGGAILHPDLAASMPTVSPDGRTWTFRLRPGLHYAPPLQRVEIKAQDVIRALKRAANPKTSAGYSFYYSVIEGFDDFATGQTDSISGLEAPDEHTLQVHLVRPTGDLGGRLSMPAAAPIPPNPFDPTAPLGVARGHDDGYGPFLVSSGPYRLEGSEAIDFSVPPDRQRPASGLVPGRSVTLVRNPSWDPSTDELRGAYVDRIEASLGGTVEEAAAAIDGGRADLVFYPGPPPTAPLEQVRRYQADPAKGMVSIEPNDLIHYASMNLAVPPLDDVHVRKAMNLIVNKARLQEIFGGFAAAEVTGHVVVNSLENDLLLDYDPYRTPGHTGSLQRAREEMALSAYDTNRDGVCDASVCSDLLAVGFNQFPFFVAQAKQIQKDLVEIGIHLDLELMPFEQGFPKIYDPKSHVALAITLPWGRDYLNGSTFFLPLFTSASIGEGVNHALLGATPQQLRRWGYPVKSVPGVDERMNSCLVEVGQAQLRCWADLDQYLMESVVPWVPFQIDNHVDVVPARIVRYSYDQFGALPALDQIALEPTP
jgi:peptide/nickel transport system substrate-binding protein